MILLYPISQYRIPFPQIENLKYHYKIKNMFLSLHFANCSHQISAINHHSLIPKSLFASYWNGTHFKILSTGKSCLCQAKPIGRLWDTFLWPETRLWLSCAELMWITDVQPTQSNWLSYWCHVICSAVSNLQLQLWLGSLNLIYQIWSLGQILVGCLWMPVWLLGKIDAWSC